MTQNKKILLITFEYPPQPGGIATYLGNIYSHQSEEELKVFIPKTKFWQIILLQTFFIFLRERFSEIHLSHILPVGYIALVFKKLFDVPYVIYTHGLDVLLPQQLAWKRFWLKEILRNATKVVANSQFTKNEILKLDIKKDIKIIYPRIKRSFTLLSYSHEWVNEIIKKYNLDGKKVILSVGRLVARKGFDKVIEALPEVLEQIPEVVYMIVGDGQCFADLSSRAKSRDLPIFFIRNASDEELHAWYNLCDIFAMPARQIGADVEGFGIVFLEAALRGKPSVGGRSGGIPEAVEDGVTGILVNPESSKEIADTLIKLLKDDNLRKQMGQAAKKRAVERFSCD